ncbi:MFS transporter [Ideonella oryzae]|uniref:MFS transporter n=1 Tax=Ideonella oryzae TaxID=2937441 RepID=A0ABT1BIF1_9BURK|nr:MFS transporter [Ideonella oryzae]MCO5975985.1 MFS transporter [Ideonella oryzae]
MNASPVPPEPRFALPVAMRWLLGCDALMLTAWRAGQVALPWWVLQAGGARHLALYAVSAGAMSLLAMPLLAPLGDRFGKRRLVALGLWAMALQAGGLAALCLTGRYSLAGVLLLTAWGMGAFAVITPAALSVTPELLPPAQLTRGLGLQKSAQAIGRVLGPVLAGSVLGVAGVGMALALYLGLMLVAAAMAQQLLRHGGLPPPTAGEAPRAWWQALRSGWQVKWAMPLERYWTLATFVVSLFVQLGMGLLLPLKVQSLGLGGGWLGACEAALAVGALAAALGGSGALVRRWGRPVTSYGALAGQVLALAGLAGLRQGPWLLPVLGLLGASVTTVQLVGQTQRLLAVPPHYRARLTAVNLTVMQAAAALGPALAGWGLQHAGVDVLYAGAALGTLLGLGAYLCIPGYRAFLSLPAEAAQGAYQRRHPGLFR